MLVLGIGATLFGLVIGWITHWSLRGIAKRDIKASDIATIIGALGGTGIVALFGNGTYLGWYGIGLAIGFFGYLIITVLLISSTTKTTEWLEDKETERKK